MLSKRIKDLSGLPFGRLVVLRYAGNRGSGGHAYWVCLCNCGKEVDVRGSHLRYGTVKSCGCLNIEVARELLTVYANSDNHKGKGNPMWRGDEAKYSSIHCWLNRNGVKKKCQFCKSTKNLDFALIAGFTHSHNLKRYMVLCRGCHIKYDKK